MVQDNEVVIKEYCHLPGTDMRPIATIDDI